MSNDREKLKALLLSEEIAQIEALRKLLNDRQALTEKVSEVLDQATDLAIAKNPKFQAKFSKIDSKAYVRAIKANKETFIDALLPIIGPMIRKSVSSAIRRFVADVNRAVEMGISAKALKWRWKALSTGVPFAEIVFNNTIEYQVQQVFLIDNHTGLLIEHAGHEENLLQDKDAMSAMLTAIQDFVKDSVNADGEGLSAAEIDDNLLWIIPGNKAKIAALIKGAPTQRLREQMLTACENIHIEFHQELANESTWGNQPELHDELEKLLLTKSQTDEAQDKKGINFWPWLIIIGALLLWWAWSSYQHHLTEQKITQELADTPGFVLNDLSYQDGGFVAKGLQDPLAKINVSEENLTFKTTAFLSLEDPIIKQRIERILKAENIEVSVTDKAVELTGITQNSEHYQNLLNIIQHQPGVESVINNVTYQPAVTLQSFLDNHTLPKTLTVAEKDGVIHITGYSTTETLTKLISELQQFGRIDSNQVELVEPNALGRFIIEHPLTNINTSELSTANQQHLDQISKKFIQLQQLQNGGTIKLIAQSDCQGSVARSNQYNRMRMKLTQDYLQNSGVKEHQILTQLIQCTTPSDDVDQSKIGVWFEVTQ